MTKDWGKNSCMKREQIEPTHWKKKSGIEDIIENFGKTCFEARNIAIGAKLFREMIEKGDNIWLGIAGAGIVGGLGGYVIDLIESGFVDVICSTGAQIYHDAHFAFGLPVIQGSPNVNDDKLSREGIVRIYDMNIKLKETLIKQDEIIRKFNNRIEKKGMEISSADYNYEFGKYILENSPHPEKSFVASAARFRIPIYWDSESNHSLALNNASLYLNKRDVKISPSKSLLEACAINYYNPQLGFFELGGGGPKNWIQQISPMISQILGKKFEGAERGIQITTAIEKDGGLSGCTFKEGVTWHKYKNAKKGLIQIYGEYSSIFPLITGYVLETCIPREPKRFMDKKKELYKRFKEIIKNSIK